MTTASLGGIGRSRSAGSAAFAEGTATALVPAARRRSVRALASLTSGSDPALRPSTALVIPCLPDNSQLIAAPTLRSPRLGVGASDVTARRPAKDATMARSWRLEVGGARGGRKLRFPFGPPRYH